MSDRSPGQNRNLRAPDKIVIDVTGDAGHARIARASIQAQSPTDEAPKRQCEGCQGANPLGSIISMWGPRVSSGHSYKTKSTPSRFVLTCETRPFSSTMTTRGRLINSTDPCRTLKSDEFRLLILSSDSSRSLLLLLGGCLALLALLMRPDSFKRRPRTHSHGEHEASHSLTNYTRLPSVVFCQLSALQKRKCRSLRSKCGFLESTFLVHID
jgi:hypothetical protein